MNDSADLRETLRRLARSSPSTPDLLAEVRLLKAFREHRKRIARRRLSWIAVAACLVLSFASVWLVRNGNRAQHPSTAGTAATAFYSESMEGFVALPYGESDVPLEQAVVVRVQVPRSELGRLGLVIPPAAKNERVNAELLVGQDGMARAVRLVDLNRP